MKTSELRDKTEQELTELETEFLDVGTGRLRYA